MAGRIILSKSVLNSLPIYFMQTSLIPYGAYDEIEEQIKRFIWGSNSEARKPHLISWGEVCKSKKDGGSGIRNVRKMNGVLLMKIAYNMLMNADSSRVQVLRNKYKYGSHHILGIIVKKILQISGKG